MVGKDHLPKDHGMDINWTQLFLLFWLWAELCGDLFSCGFNVNWLVKIQAAT